MGQQDSVFMRTFISILAVIIVFAFVMYGVAQSVSSNNQSTVGDAQKAQNIKRVAAVNSGENVASKMVRNAKAPEELGALCFGCHNTGVGGAPKVGNKADWEARAKTGVDAMVKTVIEGKGIMQKRGGTTLTDAEIKTVVQHMLKKSGL